MPATQTERRYDVDWLRVFATYLLFVFHAGKVFDVPPYYQIKNAELSGGMGLFTGFVHLWHMPLFFLLAGWSAHLSLGHRGTRTFLRERVTKLFLPFVVGCIVVCPPLKYVELLNGMAITPDGGIGQQTTFTEGFFEFFPTFFAGLERFSWSHLWFLIYLFTFTLLYTPLFGRLLRGAERFTGSAGAWLYAPIVPLAIIQMTLRARWPGYQNLYDDWANFTYYSTFFIVGFVIGRYAGLDAAVTRHWRRLGVLAVLATALLALADGGAIPLARTVRYALTAVAGYGFVVALLGFGRRFLAFTNGALRYLSESAFPVYILHQAGVVLVGHYVIRMSAGIGLKFPLLIVGAVAWTLALYHFAIRPVPVFRFLFGMRARARPAPVTATAGPALPAAQ